MRARGGEKGFALIAVLGVLALIIVYLVAAQSSVQVTHLMKRNQSDKLERSEAVQSELARLSGSDAPTSGSLTLDTQSTGTAGAALVTRRPLTAEDPVWSEVQPLARREGDALVTFQWLEPRGRQTVTRYIINTRGGRNGAIALGGTADIDAPPGEWN